MVVPRPAFNELRGAGAAGKLVVLRRRPYLKTDELNAADRLRCARLPGGRWVEWLVAGEGGGDEGARMGCDCDRLCDRSLGAGRTRAGFTASSSAERTGRSAGAERARGDQRCGHERATD